MVKLEVGNLLYKKKNPGLIRTGIRIKVLAF